ncbi:MAG TPA: TerB family tellurite resistance protein [Gammaproteobacteria bacterium]|nr:TerB family tellurite resistance protein [Gammaproteobacteria bacterium]
MFASLTDFLERRFGDNTAAPDRDAAVRLAVAALCIEMVRADYEEQPEELARAGAALATRFGLDKSEAAALLDAGRSHADQSVSLYRFTRPLNAALDMPGKLALIEMLWKVALEDGKLDKYEDALMHKLADLLYVPLADLMLAKQRVLNGV